MFARRWASALPRAGLLAFCVRPDDAGDRRKTMNKYEPSQEGDRKSESRFQRPAAGLLACGSGALVPGSLGGRGRHPTATLESGGQFLLPLIGQLCP